MFCVVSTIDEHDLFVPELYQPVRLHETLWKTKAESEDYAAKKEEKKAGLDFPDSSTKTVSTLCPQRPPLGKSISYKRKNKGSKIQAYIKFSSFIINGLIH